MISVPTDCTLIPTQKGALLVSPSYGLYCAILTDEIASIDRYIQNPEQTELSQELLDRLDKHGFFGDPRPYDYEPPLLQFQLTRACNLHCIYCAVQAGKPRPKELTLDEVKRTIDEAVAIYPNLRISFTGGEPLLVPWVFEAIEYAKKKSKYVGLLSNLLLLKDNDELFQRIVQFVHEGHQLRMSMSAIDRDLCNRLSGKDCYDDAIEVLKRLEAANALPHLDIPLSAPDSDANTRAFPAFRRSIPNDVDLFFAKMYSGGREKGHLVYQSSDDEEAALDDLVFEGGTCIQIEKQSPVTYRRKGCACIDNHYLCIQSDGAVFSCFRLVEPIGHISEGLQTIVDRREKTPLPMALEPCRSCPFVNLCACGCRSDAHIFQSLHHKPICGKWRKRLVAEMLFEDRPYIFDWPLLYLMAEAHKRGLDRDV